MQQLLARLPHAPWIITPIAPSSVAMAESNVQQLLQQPDIDVIEWRVDAAIAKKREVGSGCARTLPQLWAEVTQIAQVLRAARKPLLCTLRTEDPRVEICGDYREWVEKLIGLQPDLIDIEAAQPGAQQLATQAHNAGIPVLASKHYFAHAPQTSVAFSAELRSLAAIGEVAKLAIATTNATQLEEFEQAAKAAAQSHPTLAIVMGENGRASRTSWAQWGNWATFATAGYSSAPGQLSIAEVLREWRASGLR